MTPLERSARAKELLENPVLKEAFAGIKTDIIAKLESIALEDFQLQHELTLTLQLLKQLRNRLDRFVDDGKIEQKKIEQQNWIEKARQRFRA
jgi:hypothetical protein